MRKDPFPLATDRLLLRRFRDHDTPAFVAYRSDPEVARFQSWSAVNADEARALIERQQAAQFAIPGEWFQIAIARRETDELVGDVGVCVRLEDPTRAEIGFTVSRENQGQGLATEAVRRVFALLFRETEVQRIEATTDARNLASIRLLCRLGMRPTTTERVMFKGEPCDESSFVIQKQDWPAERI
jgi:RimJ/RimL family protein N-acetyltransferase